MFYVRKDLMHINSRIEYPLTIATADQCIYINGTSHYFVGDSEVKCDEGDNFNSAFGKELAETNATINMLKEYKRVLIRFTKQPEWRKEKKPEKLKNEIIVEPRDIYFGTETNHVNIFNNNSDKKIKVTVEVL